MSTASPGARSPPAAHRPTPRITVHTHPAQSGTASPSPLPSPSPWADPSVHAHVSRSNILGMHGQPLSPGVDQKIYVLSADGSSLFLLDPSRPEEHEEPPPYATVGRGGDDAATDSQNNIDDGDSGGTAGLRAPSMGLTGRSRTSSGIGLNGQRSPSPATGRGLNPSPASFHSPSGARNAMFLPEVRIDTLVDSHQDHGRTGSAGAGPSTARHRASTLSALQLGARGPSLLSPPPASSSRAPQLSAADRGSTTDPRRARPRYRAEHSYSGSPFAGSRVASPVSPSASSHHALPGSDGYSPSQSPTAHLTRPQVGRSRSSLSSISTTGQPRRAASAVALGRQADGFGVVEGHEPDERTPLLFARPALGARTFSSPLHAGADGADGDLHIRGEDDETALAPIPAYPRRGGFRSILCGDMRDLPPPSLPSPLGPSAPGSDSPTAAPGPPRLDWSTASRLYFAPLHPRLSLLYFSALLHLTVFSFPLALAVWPVLLVGTLAGTALLITLPLGAAVWWLTLVLARSAARAERGWMVRWHGGLEGVEGVAHARFEGRLRTGNEGGDGVWAERREWEARAREALARPVFYRIKGGTPPLSPGAGMTSPARAERGEAWPSAGIGASAGRQDPPPAAQDVRWEKGFIKCSWAMYCDHSSYSALCYFLLIKPLIVLPTLIFFVALFVPCMVLVLPLPMYLRAARRWGQWQAAIALENL